jgi:hypothetical protein
MWELQRAGVYADSVQKLITEGELGYKMERMNEVNEQEQRDLIYLYIPHLFSFHSQPYTSCREGCTFVTT